MIVAFVSPGSASGLGVYSQVCVCPDVYVQVACGSAGIVRVGSMFVMFVLLSVVTVKVVLVVWSSCMSCSSVRVVVFSVPLRL